MAVAEALIDVLLIVPAKPETLPAAAAPPPRWTRVERRVRSDSSPMAAANSERSFLSCSLRETALAAVIPSAPPGVTTTSNAIFHHGWASFNIEHRYLFIVKLIVGFCSHS